LDIAVHVKRIVQDRTIRLVATAPLRDLALLKLVGKGDLDVLEEIEGATSGRSREQKSGADRLDSRELVYGISEAHLINAAFSHWLPRSLNR